MDTKFSLFTIIPSPTVAFIHNTKQCNPRPPIKTAHSKCTLQNPQTQMAINTGSEYLQSTCHARIDCKKPMTITILSHWRIGALGLEIKDGNLQLNAPFFLLVYHLARMEEMIVEGCSHISWRVHFLQQKLDMLGRMSRET